MVLMPWLVPLYLMRESEESVRKKGEVNYLNRGKKKGERTEDGQNSFTEGGVIWFLHVIARRKRRAERRNECGNGIGDCSSEHIPIISLCNV